MNIQVSHADLWCSAIIGALCGMAWAWAMFVRQEDHTAPGTAFSFPKFCWPVLAGAAVGLIRRMHAHDVLSVWGAVDRIGGIGMVFVGLLILRRHVISGTAGAGSGFLSWFREKISGIAIGPFILSLKPKVQDPAQKPADPVVAPPVPSPAAPLN